MPYTITKTDGSILADILDNSVDKASTDLTLVGKSTNNYGLQFNQNFVKLLENFANTSPPKNPMKGQIWYDTSEEKIRIWNGKAFKEPNRPQISSVEPTLSPGDIWIDSLRRQLYFNDGQGTTLAGPLYTAQQGLSGNEIVNLVDNTGVTRTIIKLKIGGSLLGVFSKDTFTPGPQNANTGILINEGITGIIRKGFTPAKDLGFTFYGTALNAQNLIDGSGNVISVSNFVQTTGNSFINGALTIVNSLPLTLGASNNLTFEIGSNLTTLKSNIQNSDLILNVKNAAGSSNAIYIDATRSRVGIYNSAPLATLDVNGDANFRNNIVTNKQSIDIVNTTATTVNLAGAATTINIGATIGNSIVRNNLNVVQNVNIDGGNLNSTLTNFNLFNTTVKTINMGAVTNAINIGSITGIVNFKNNADVTRRLTVSGGIQANNVLIENNTVRVTSGSLLLNANNAIEFEKDTLAKEDLVLRKKLIFDQSGTPEITSLNPAATFFSFLPENIQTIDFGAEATRINIGAAIGNTYIRHNLNVVGEVFIGYDDSTPAYLKSKTETMYVFDTKTQNIYLGGKSNNILIGDTDGQFRVRNAIAYFDGDVVIKGSSITGAPQADIRSDIDTKVASVFNQNITSLAIGGAAFNIEIGNTFGQTIVKNNLAINGSVTISGRGANSTGTLTVGQNTSEFDFLPEFVTNLKIGAVASQIKIGRIEDVTKDQIGGTVYIQHDLNIINDLVMPKIDSNASGIGGAGLIFKDNKNIITSSDYVRTYGPSRALGILGDIYLSGRIYGDDNIAKLWNAEIQEDFILDQGQIKSLSNIVNLFVDTGNDIGVQVDTINIGNQNTVVTIPGRLKTTWKVIKNNYEAVAGDRLLIDTAKFNNSGIQIANNVQIFLPLTPNVGDEIRFVDKTGISTLGQLFIRRNGNLINDTTDDITINSPGRAFNLVYTGAVRGWVYDNA
jgi:hypothetical protein